MDYVIIDYGLKTIYKNKKYSHKNGKPHSYNDLPAIVYEDGTKYWYQNGFLHRDNNQPAAIYADGTVEYWIHGKKTSLLTNWIVEGF